VPLDFAKGVFFAPHNFSDPERADYAEYVNFQLRKDLFDDVFGKVSMLEFSQSIAGSASVKIDKIEECQRDDTLLESLKTKIYTSSEDDLIRCEDWTVSSSASGRSRYRIKLYQSQRDRFFSLVYPPKLNGYFSLYWNSQI